MSHTVNKTQFHFIILKTHTQSQRHHGTHHNNITSNSSIVKGLVSDQQIIWQHQYNGKTRLLHCVHCILVVFGGHWEIKNGWLLLHDSSYWLDGCDYLSLQQFSAPLFCKMWDWTGSCRVSSTPLENNKQNMVVVTWVVQSLNAESHGISDRIPQVWRQIICTALNTLVTSL